jgi:hypothetical protein
MKVALQQIVVTDFLEIAWVLPKESPRIESLKQWGVYRPVSFENFDWPLEEFR